MKIISQRGFILPLALMVFAAVAFAFLVWLSVTYSQSEYQNDNQTVKVCHKTGCSGQICSDEEAITDCLWRSEYVCYSYTTCERQANGQCAWTENSVYQNCLKEHK